MGGADPFFVNAAAGDYRVRSGSSAYGSGAVLPADVAAAIGVPAGAAPSRGALLWPGMKTTPLPTGLVRNTAEAGTVGANVTTANSGGASGLAFNPVLTGSGSTVQFSSAAAHGSRGYAVAFGSGNAGALTWQGFQQPSLSVRYGVRLDAAPTATTFLGVIYASGGSLQVWVTPSRTLWVTAGSAPGWQSAAVVPIGSWFSLRAFVSVGTTTSNGVAKLDLTPAGSSSPAASVSWTSLNLRGSASSPNVNNVQFGQVGTTTWHGVEHLDDLAADDTATGFLPLP